MPLLSGLRPVLEKESLQILTSSDNVSWKVSEGNVASLLGVDKGSTVRLSDLLDYILLYIAQNKMTVETNLTAQNTSTGGPKGIGIVFDSGAPMTH